MSALTSVLAAPTSNPDITSDPTPDPVSLDRYTKNYVNSDYVDSDNEETINKLNALRQKYKGGVAEQSKGKLLQLNFIVLFKNIY